MKGNFVERPEHMRPTEVEWKEVRHLTDAEGGMSFCLPLGCEQQMFAIVNCHECERPARWIGVGTPFDDGQQYLMKSQSWCFWCFPREHFSAEELPLVRQAEWARKQTADEIFRIIRDARFGQDQKTIELLVDLEGTICAAMQSREEKLRLRAEWKQGLAGIVRT